MKQWIRHHVFALRITFGHLRNAPASFMFNVLVVAIAFALPFAGLTVLDNVHPLAREIAVAPEISLFMKMDTPRDKANALGPSIRRIVQADYKTAGVEFIAREKALEALNSKSGLSDVLKTLGSNPLPDAYVVKLEGLANGVQAANIDTITTQLQALPGVETVQIDSAWIKRLAALMHVLRIALLLLAATLGVVVIAVVFNTVRLQVMTQLDEIALSRLVGATDAFIHRPFYYAGALLGMCGGILALIAVALSLQPLNARIAEFAHLYASEFQLQPLGLADSAMLLAISAGLGLAGAMLSVKRHLDHLG